MIFRGAMSNDALWKILRKFENQKWKLIDRFHYAVQDSTYNKR